MVILSLSTIKEFITRNPLGANALNKWYAETKKSDWSSFSEVKQTWNTCDAIGNDRYIFDIGGNKYRIIAMILFNKRTVYIRKILTHEEYSELSKKGGLNTL